MILFVNRWDQKNKRLDEKMDAARKIFSPLRYYFSTTYKL